MSNESINSKTLEELENDFWINPETFPTGLVENVYLLRKKKLTSLNSNEIRLLITQNVGLKYLISIAFDILKDNILHEALYFPGDLLSAVMNIEDAYWVKNPDQLNIITSFIEKNKNEINKAYERDEVDEELIESIKKFILKSSK